MVARLQQGVDQIDPGQTVVGLVRQDRFVAGDGGGHVTGVQLQGRRHFVKVAGLGALGRGFRDQGRGLVLTPVLDDRRRQPGPGDGVVRQADREVTVGRLGPRPLTLVQKSRRVLEREHGIVRKTRHAVGQERHDRLVMFGADQGLGQIFPGPLPVGLGVAGGPQMRDRLGPLMAAQLERTQVVVHGGGIGIKVERPAVGRQGDPADAHAFRRMAHHRPLPGVEGAPGVQAGKQFQRQVVGPRLIGRRRAQAQDFDPGAAGHGGLIGGLSRVGQAPGLDQLLHVVVDGHARELAG